MARPPKPIDLKLLEDLARIQCTDAEMAAILDYSKDAWSRRLRREPALRLLIEKGRENGRSSLRRIQWKSALGGNTTMQIWLGKQYLQQRDMHSAELTGAKGERLIPAEMVLNLDETARAALRDLRNRLPKAG